MYVDPELLRQARLRPDLTVEVIVVCPAYSEALRDALAGTGFEITDLRQAEHGLIYGRIRLAALERLRELPGIESVTPDSTQYAQ